jgi:hypothetical protein
MEAIIQIVCIKTALAKCVGWARKARCEQTDFHLVSLVPLVSPVTRSEFIKPWNAGAYPAEDFI